MANRGGKWVDASKFDDMKQSLMRHLQTTLNISYP